MIWRVARRLVGQMRAVAGLNGVKFSGVDMTAALAMARASGISEELAVEILPDVAGIMVKRLNEHG